jgi:hypothetical protein
MSNFIKLELYTKEIACVNKKNILYFTKSLYSKEHIAIYMIGQETPLYCTHDFLEFEKILNNEKLEI